MNVVIRVSALAVVVLSGACTSNALQTIDTSGFALNGPVPAVAAESDAIAAIIAEASQDLPPEFPGETTGDAAAAPAANREAAVAEAPRTEAAPAEPQAVAATEARETGETKRKGFFSAFWPSRDRADGQLVTASISQGDADRPAAGASRSGKSARLTRKSETRLASSFRDTGTALPGVRTDELFEIKHRSGKGDDSDVDALETDGGYRVASAAGGLARLAPHGLRTQHPQAEVGCLKPGLVKMLKTIERHYGRPVVITSGYRDPGHNRRVNGARNSQHMHCAAADIQIAGVSKWELAKFVRTLPGRGGVGTYCHTESVHVDIGPERDWNWRCRSRRKS